MKYTEISENIISLRTALFSDNGFIASLTFLPKTPNEDLPLVWVYRRPIPIFKYFSSEYRKLRTVSDSMRASSFPLGIRPTFIWSDDGVEVAVLINRQPWAFLGVEMKSGCSKSIRHPTIGGNPWNERLFQEKFKIYGVTR